VEQILFSGQATMSKLYFLAIEKVFSHSLFTAAQSTNVSIESSVVFFHFSRDFFIQAAHTGSAHISFVFFFNSSVIDISPEITHHHQIGQII
jgi:hypothetical protein